jgi:hypothetical protein
VLLVCDVGGGTTVDSPIPIIPVRILIGVSRILAFSGLQTRTELVL